MTVLRPRFPLGKDTSQNILFAQEKQAQWHLLSKFVSVKQHPDISYPLISLTFACVIGRSGMVLAEQKAEGDGATPIGDWPVRCLYYRPDRIAEDPDKKAEPSALPADHPADGLGG